MRALTNNEVLQASGGVKLGRFILDACIGALTGAIGGALAGPGGMITGACVGAISAMTADIANGQYDAAQAANMSEQQRQIDLRNQNDDMLRFINA